MDRQKISEDREIFRLSDGWINRHTDKQTDGRMYRWIDRQMCKKTA